MVRKQERVCEIVKTWYSRDNSRLARVEMAEMNQVKTLGSTGGVKDEKGSR